MSMAKNLLERALSSNSDISELLRTTYAVARKLKVKDLAEWADRELKGYPPGTDIPKYRYLKGNVRAHNPYCGWIPIIIQDPHDAKKFTTMPCNLSVPEIQSLVKDSEGQLVMSYAHTDERDLMRHTVGMDGVRLNFEVRLFITHSALTAILETVKSQILDWAIKLDEQGSQGNDLPPGTQELQKSASVHYTFNNNFHGNVSHTQLQQHSVSGNQSMDSKTPEPLKNGRLRLGRMLKKLFMSKTFK
jgi:hypothetical protein